MTGSSICNILPDFEREGEDSNIMSCLEGENVALGGGDEQDKKIINTVGVPNKNGDDGLRGILVRRREVEKLRQTLRHGFGI